MKTASSILSALAGIAGLALIILGLLLWFGRAYVVLPLHIGLGILLVLALLTQAVLAARAGANRGLVAFAIVWGVIVPVFGMAQANILPGPYHWVIRVLHLAVGMAAMRLVDVLGKQVRRGVAAKADAPRTVTEGRATA